MKEIITLLFILTLCVYLRAQNNYNNSNIYYNNPDTTESSDRQRVSVFLNELHLKDSVLRRYMDVSIEGTSTLGYFENDGSGVFFIILFDWNYRDKQYFYCEILPCRNSFMRYTLYDNMRDTNVRDLNDKVRLIGYVDYRGYLFVVKTREYIQEEDVNILFEQGKNIKEIKIYDNHMPIKPVDLDDEYVNYYSSTEVLKIPYKKKRR